MRPGNAGATIVFSVVCRILPALLAGIIALSDSGAAADPVPNLLDNPGAEAQIPAAQVKADLPLGYFLNNHFLELADTAPEGWGLFSSADTKIKWGATDKEAHSGKYSCFLTLVDPLGKDTGWLFERILLGKSNGYSGEKAIPVSPRTMYEYSFWVKGDASKINVETFTWSTDDGNKAGMKFAYTSHANEAIGAEWKQIAGTFMPPADARRMAVAIRMLSAKPGQTLYVDDAVISVKAAPAVPAPRPAGQLKSFLGYRALVVRPDIPWSRDYDKVVHAELLRRGIEVVYGEPELLAHPEGLAQFDIVVTNVKRRFTAEQVAGVKAYVTGGGALYGSWGGTDGMPGDACCLRREERHGRERERADAAGQPPVQGARAA
jgi:hypothetical protein